MTTIAILGARGRLGRVVAQAFLRAGYSVRAVTRDGRLPAGLEGATSASADAMDRAAVVKAVRGADIVFNGLNPAYTDWKAKCLPMAENVVAACQEGDAVQLFPGNVYNFGSPMPAELAESTPFAPTTRKGTIRLAMERLFLQAAQESGVRTVVLRAGDFFGGSGTGSWFDLAVVAKLGKGVFTAPGNPRIVHAWAYLPDLASTFVALAGKLDRLGTFETLHFPGHAITGLEMKASAEKVMGQSLRLASMPWWAIRVGSPLVPMWREIAEMSYLHFEPHRLVSDRLNQIVETVPHTPLDIAMRQALADLGIVPEKERNAA